MKTKRVRQAAGVAGAAIVFGAALWMSTSSGKAAPEAMNRTPPVLVELFTSEGCSSCPPADTVLARLQRVSSIGGAQVIALGEHVDYWDRNGWRDPFSSAAFSARQSQYAAVFHNDQVYTPQMIVDGRAEFVGSDERRAHAAIVEAARQVKAGVSLAAPIADGNQVRLHISVSSVPAAIKNATIYAAVAEDGLSSQVKGGENSGRRLAHVAVVRALVHAGATDAQRRDFNGDITLPLDSRWNRRNLRLVVFVQGRDTGQIVGAAERKLGE